MPTINYPSRPFTDTLERGNALTVACDASGTALVNLRGPSGSVQSSSVAAGRSVVYGPYLHDMQVVVSVVSGSVTVAESISDSLQFANVPQYATDPTTGAVVGLVGPDGGVVTLYGNAGDFCIDYIVSGLLVPNAGAIGAASLPSGVAYITGKRVTYGGGILALAATSDNYIDIDRDGVVTVSSVAVAAGAPAKAVNSLRLGRVTTNATNVTGRTIDAADSNGNWLGNFVGKPYCRVVNGTLVNYFSGRDAALPFGASTTRYDNTAMHSETVNNTRFTAQRSGLYRFSGFVNVPNTASLQNVTVKPFVDGAAAALGNRTFQVPAVQSLMVEGSVQLRAGQYMEMWLQNPTAALDVSSCGFTLEWVG